MSQAKEKAQALNTKITKKSAAAKKTTKAAAPSPTDDLSEKLSNCVVTDGDNCDLFSSCEELVHEKLENILSNLKCKSSSSKTADEVRKKVHEEKCVSEESLQNIKLFFADVKNCKDDEGVSASRYCVVASKYLRIFIDILEVTAFDEVDFVLQACDLVITVHQYFFMKGKLEDCFEKLIPMLHHIIKQLYKKQSIPCIVTIIKNITNLLHIASKKKEAELADESKRSFTLIHQMCYSLYFKELQILIKNQNKQTDITSNVDLRINSLIILAFSNWNENKFIEHLSNFISNESVILMKSCTYNEQVLSESLQNLLKNLYRLIDLELKNEKPVLVKSLLIFTWKLGHMYTNFCMFNRLHSELITFLDFVPINLKTKFECLKKGADLLKETASICGLIIQNKCTCKGKNSELNGYVKLVLTYYASYSTGNTADVSRLFDILNSWKLQLKDGNQLCGCFVNVLLEMVLFLSEELIKVHQTERLKQMLVMLSFVRGLMMQIQMHLFPDSKNTLQCYTNEEIRAVFINTFNNLVTSLQSSLTSLRTDIKYDDIKWLAVVYKIGGLYYNQRQYKIAVPSLKFSIFLSDWACENNGASETNVKEIVKKFNILSECQSKTEQYDECLHTYLESIKQFSKLSPDELVTVKSMLEQQVSYYVKKKLQQSPVVDGKNETVLERSLFDEISCSEDNISFMSLMLEYEFYAYKKYGNNHDIKALMKRLFTLRKDLYEKEQEMLKYALCMIEMSTSSSFKWSERFHWCTEAVGMVEEFYANLEGNKDNFEWHVRDVLAVSLFQRGVIQYEEKVADSISKSATVHVVANSLSESSGDQSINKEKTTLLDDDFTTSLNAALNLWIEITEKALEGDQSKGELFVFYDAEGSAKCLYHSAVFYSLLSQNFNAVKASYLSGLIYQMLSLSTGDDTFKEKQVESWVLTASQFLLVKNVSNGEVIVGKLQEISEVIDSAFSKLHIDVLKSACQLYSGNTDSSTQSFHLILNNAILNDRTKSSLIIKSDIYFLLSDLKLITIKEGKGEIINPPDQHFPVSSPFPPISDCLRYLRSLYSKYVEGSGTEGVEVTLSSNWGYLDKLLICLSRNAELLKHQGSIYEAKTLLKEALMLTRKYNLSLRTVEVLQQLTSMNIILSNEKSFYETYDQIKLMLGSTVENCFTETQLFAPDFINHNSMCSCNYCIYPKLQEVHIILYLQHIEGKQLFSQLAAEEDESYLQVIDTLVKNAYERYISCLNEVNRISSLSLSTVNNTEIVVLQETNKRGKKPPSKRGKSKSDIICKSDIIRSEEDAYNLFLRYSLEAKLNKSITDNYNMITTVEELISKAELTTSFQQTHHEYHRLRAQLYRLRSILCLGEDIVEKVWFSQGDENKDMSKIICTPMSNKKDTKRKVLSAKKAESNLVTEETPRLTARKGRTKKLRKSKLNVSTDEIAAEVKAKPLLDSSNGVSVMKCLEDLQNSLSVLNPYTDALIIKAIYQLLMILSGTFNKDMTISCQLLSASRTLHQQILTSYGKKLRDRLSVVKPKSQQSDGKHILEKTSTLLEKYSGPTSVFDPESIKELIKDNIPQDWCICSLSLTEFENKRYLIICRLEAFKEPTLMKINLVDKPQYNDKSVVCDLIAAFDEVDLLEQFNSLIDKSQESMKITDKSLWWAERVNLDKELKASITRLEEEWLKGWKGMLFGQYLNKDVESNCASLTDDICERILASGNQQVDKTLIECIVRGFQHCSKYQILDSLQTLFGDENESVYEIFVECFKKHKFGKMIKKLEKEDGSNMSARKPIVLILDKTLQKLPWESMSIFQNQPVTRMPSFLMTSSHCKNYEHLINEGVRINKCCYVLNPKDDLKRTEEKFADWFKRLDGWNGIVGRPPTQAEYSDAISDNDLFIYCGHGSGQEYLGWSAVHRLQSSAVALLMGCSSGKLTVEGELEAHGMVLYYLSAGCPAVVANLWHVTDKDIDSFLETLLKLWIEEETGSSLAHCVSKARRSCKLKYLNGAAPIVYGLPLSVQKT